MKEIIEALRTLQAEPDDLSNLPTIVAQLEEYQTNTITKEQEYQDRIVKLQDSNRSLLSQIPINDGKPPSNEEDNKPSFEDAQQELIKAMQNVGGN